GLKEMCFGSFEGRNYIEMEHDPDYKAWVAANCESSCPDGERKDDFSDRECRTFAALVDKALADGEEMLVILDHGGTQ
ncbi:UNVERIFIED_CONTAM: histidine phosphatase family protein, partial [Bacteroidetes bacterium 56_B9]